MKRRNSKVYRWWLFLAALTLVVMGLPLWLSPAAASNTITILEEHFDAPQVPAGWSVNNLLAGIGWRFDDPGSRGNNTGGNGGFAIADSDHAGFVQMDTSLETPSMDLSSYAQVSLEFKTYYYPYMNDYVTVDVSNDNGITWTELWKQTSTAFEGTVNLNLTAQAAGKANIKIRFHYGNAYYAYYWKIDAVKVSGETAPVPTPIPPTPTPSAPVAPSALAQS
ncbi:MAG: choice-of-anchor J domain-containing protein, partial [Anaerolineae bacterium]|nr:choice-of-anchor J domain-containing protein [Anaerolineae bacterium]